MPNEDSQKVWFPEMLAALRAAWQPFMPLPKILKLRDDLDRLLRQIRRDRQIVSPVVRCEHCGASVPAAAPRVSVRALILASARFKITSPNAAMQIDKNWARFRAQNGLDLHGKPKVPAEQTPSDQQDNPCCAHSALTP